MKKTALVFVLLINFIFVGCTDSPTALGKPHGAETDSLSFYGSANFKLPALSPKAAETAGQWPVFTDFKTQVELINTLPIAQLRAQSDLLVQYADTIAKGVPGAVHTQPIKSRLIVIKTRASLLHQEVQKQRLDSTTLAFSIAEMNSAAQNLIVQLNDVFLKNTIDAQRSEGEEAELKKQQRIRDSVFQLEIQQKNNTGP
ncbi:MAG: hypothetical protein ACPG7E_01910 [Marinirhabdus sp.]